MHQASLRALAPLRAPATRSWAGSRTAGSLAARVFSGRAQFFTAASTPITRSRSVSSHRTLVSKPAVLAYSSDSRGPIKYEIDFKHEKEVGKEKLTARPDEVTADSSVRPIIEHSQNLGSEKLPDVSEALGDDLHSIKDAVALTEVPREAYALGLSGTIPYFITSLSTIYLGWTIRSGPSTSPNSLGVSSETAQQWLQMLEPVQLGYGAVIISSLGAVHWGMELMEKKPDHERMRFRYTMGILAPAVAWPTLFLPVHFALTGQFLAFTVLFFADSRATKRGWAPQWYSTYRFVLTAVVGSAIFVSLLFRAKIDDVGENMTQRLEKGMHQRGPTEEDYTTKWAKREKKEKKIKAEEKKKEEEKAKAEKSDGEDAKDEKADQDNSTSGDTEEDKTQKKGSGDEVKTGGDASSKKKSSKGDEKSTA